MEEERINDSEEKPIETMQSEQQREGINEDIFKYTPQRNVWHH